MKRTKTWERAGDLKWVAVWEIFREREHFSLKYRAIRPSAVFGIRKKAVLRGEGFTWVPYLRSLDKLLEVGVSPYLGFILRLSTL